MKEALVISAAVEGIVDEAVVRKVIVEAGGYPGTVYGKNGKTFLRRQTPGYNNAARHLPRGWSWWTSTATLSVRLRFVQNGFPILPHIYAFA